MDAGATPRWAVFRERGFPLYWGVLLLTGFAVQIQTVAIGWFVYDLTRNPFDLGLVGLSQFLPALALVLVTGTVADRYPRRMVMAVCLSIMASCGAGLIAVTASGLGAPWPIFLLLALFGAARAFYNPARQAMLPNLVPPAQLGRAVAMTTPVQKLATICGPVTGGLLYAISPQAAFGGALTMLVIAAALALAIPRPAQRTSPGRPNWASLSAGFRYIWTEKVLLGAISLDLFAVLLGGATALLPVYARDILHIGPTGLGVLMAAPAVGAISVSLFLVARPIADNAGRIMFITVAVFGLGTLVFAWSEFLWLSIVALAVMGGADTISVNIRNTLIQLWTPDELRGRVSAVNQVFIGASNELGAFRAGTMAALIGPVGAVVAGGFGTLAVVGLWSRWFPDLVRIRRLSG